jgi:hypothetical protein
MSSVKSYFSKTLQVRLTNSFAIYFHLYQCQKILTKMLKRGASYHMSFILICHYTRFAALLCQVITSILFLFVMYCHFSVQPKFIFQYMCKYNFTG